MNSETRQRFPPLTVTEQLPKTIGQEIAQQKNMLKKEIAALALSTGFFGLLTGLFAAGTVFAAREGNVGAAVFLATEAVIGLGGVRDSAREWRDAHKSFEK